MTSPREVALAMLDARFGVASRRGEDPGLAAFQQDALDRIVAILERRRGALLADSVGLGKTHVAAALIRRVAAGGSAVLVCGPAVLHAHWKRHLRRVHFWHWCSHTSLSRGRAPPDRAWRLVVVDEAHAFRHPDTQRHRALARVCRAADVLLLTATPVNNTVLDFYHLIRLFADDAAFHDIGVPDMRAAFDAAARSADTGDVRRIAEAVMVRRTRSFIRAHCLDARDPALRFPESAPIRTVDYDIDAAYDDFATMLDDIARLHFPAHAHAAGAHATALLRLGLLKRCESSPAALRASLQRHVRILTAYSQALRRGFVLDAREYRVLLEHTATEVQLLLEPAVLRAVPPAWNAAAAADAAARDLALLRQMLGNVNAVADDKLARVRDLLAGELRGERVLLFTEFAETATTLWRALRDHWRCALIHGSRAYLGRQRSGRRAVIERFAPHANGVRVAHARERVDILIATDVLAEGLNLQDARVVISYDLPWNPVRLAQRIGRIDRLGSPHERIEALTFAPDRRLEAMLGLVRRLRRKLRAIRAVGGDAPHLGRASAPLAGIDGRRPGESANPVVCDDAPRPELYDAPGPGAPSAPFFGGYRMGELDVVERLRVLHRAARCGAADNKPEQSPGETIPVAAMPWDRPTLVSATDPTHAPFARRASRERDRGVILCCFRNGRSVRLRTVTSRGAIVEHDATVDDALLCALEHTEHRQPDMRAFGRAGTLALAGLDRPPRNDRTRRRAAALVQRWLADRSAVGSAEDYVRADRLLRLILEPATSLRARELERALAGRGSIGARLDRLDAVLRRYRELRGRHASGAVGANTRDDESPDRCAPDDGDDVPCLIAALQLIPQGNQACA